MLKKIVPLTFAFAALAIVISCTANNSTDPGKPTNNSVVANSVEAGNNATTNDETSQGRELYVAQCAECHKESGEGGVVVVDGRKMKADNLTDERRKKLTDEKMIKTMVDGIPDEGMPSYKDKLSEGEMREVVRFIRVDLQKLSASPPYPTSTVQPQ